MSKKHKIWLVIAAFLIVTGGLIFTIAMTKHNWDFSKLNTVEYEFNTYTIAEEFNEIVIDIKEADIVFIPSEDNTTKVVCNEMKLVKHSVSVLDKKLTIKSNDERQWYDDINIVNLNAKLMVYLPAMDFITFDVEITEGDFTIENIVSKNIVIDVTTGDIEFVNVKCVDISVESTTGDVEFNDVNVTNAITIDTTTGDVTFINVLCDKLGIETTSGKTKLTNVIATNEFLFDGTTGDVKLDGVDSNFIDIKVTTGDVKGTILTDKIFNVKNITGIIDVPDTYSGGICKITVTTGDIIILYK